MKLFKKFGIKKPKDDENSFLGFEQLPIIEIPEEQSQNKIQKLGSSVSNGYGNLSQNAVQFFGKGVNTVSNTGNKVAEKLKNSKDLVQSKYQEVVIKPKLIALLHKTDTEKLLDAIDLISLPAKATPKTLVAIAILRNLVFTLDKYKKGLESKEETQSELNAFFSQIEMKDVFSLALPVISKFQPNSGKILNSIIPLLITKK